MASSDGRANGPRGYTAMASVASMVRQAAGAGAPAADPAPAPAAEPGAPPGDDAAPGGSDAGGSAAGGPAGGMFGGTNAFIIAAVIIVVLFLILRLGGAAGEGEVPRPKKSEGAERERFAAPPAKPREEPEANPLGAKNTLSVQTAEDAQNQWQDLLSQESSAPHPLLSSTTSDGPGRLPQLNGGRIASDMGLPGQAF